MAPNHRGLLELLNHRGLTTNADAGLWKLLGKTAHIHTFFKIRPGRTATIQPTNQPTNFYLCATDFSVKVVQLSTPNFPLTKKGLKNKPVYYWGCTTSPIPRFLEEVLELFCRDIQCPSWKYYNGHILKITHVFPNH